LNLRQNVRSGDWIFRSPTPSFVNKSSAFPAFAILLCSFFPIKVVIYYARFFEHSKLFEHSKFDGTRKKNKNAL